MRGGGWLRAVRLERDEAVDRDAYPYSLRAVQALKDELALDPAVTFLVGDNGSGKSTLVEALAVAAGFNAEGGSRSFNFETRGSTSSLHQAIRIVRDVRRPSTGSFLRAESFFNVATEVEALGAEVTQAYGDRGLHEQSPGESFLSLALHRFGPNGLYLFDEPEAALSPQGCLTTIDDLDDRGLEPASYDDTHLVATFRAFLASPDAFLRHLLA